MHSLGLRNMPSLMNFLLILNVKQPCRFMMVLLENFPSSKTRIKPLLEMSSPFYNPLELMSLTIFTCRMTTPMTYISLLKGESILLWKLESVFLSNGLKDHTLVKQKSYLISKGYAQPRLQLIVTCLPLTRSFISR